MEKNKLNHMENQILKFKTNINCGGCVSKVKPALDEAESIEHWEVDTNNPDKVLTVSGIGVVAQEVMDLVKLKGFTISEVQ
jgi:copper chaperone